MTICLSRKIREIGCLYIRTCALLWNLLFLSLFEKKNIWKVKGLSQIKQYLWINSQGEILENICRYIQYIWIHGDQALFNLGFTWFVLTLSSYIPDRNPISANFPTYLPKSWKYQRLLSMSYSFCLSSRCSHIPPLILKSVTSKELWATVHQGKDVTYDPWVNQKNSVEPFFILVSRRHGSHSCLEICSYNGVHITICFNCIFISLLLHYDQHSNVFQLPLQGTSKYPGLNTEVVFPLATCSATFCNANPLS